MNKTTMQNLAAVGLLGLVGCTTPDGQVNRTGTGALAGTAIGAGTGAIIGHQSGHTGQGALIGGVVGALAGALIGQGMDQQQRERLATESPSTYQRVQQGQPLGLADIKALSKAGLSDEVIISQIRNSRTAYRLTTAEIIDLKDSGVSQKVIDFMINTPSLYPPPPARPYPY